MMMPIPQPPVMLHSSAEWRPTVLTDRFVCGGNHPACVKRIAANQATKCRKNSADANGGSSAHATHTDAPHRAVFRDAGAIRPLVLIAPALS